MKWFIGVIAPLAIGLIGAPVAGADPLTANDREFIAETDRVIMMHDASNPDGRWVGYPKVPVLLRIDTAHTVCDMLDANIITGIGDFIVTAFDDRREHAGYLAAWFEQSAIVHFCPRHSDKLSNI